MNTFHELVETIGAVVVSVAALACLLLLLPAGPGLAAEPPPPAAIPVAEIATRAAGVSNLLRSLTPSPSAEIKMIERRLAEARDKMELEVVAARSILRGEPTLDMLQAQQLIWQRRRMQTSEWLALLTQRATVLQSALGRLADLQQTWRATRDAAQASGAPEALLDQVGSALVQVAATQAVLETRRTTMLDLQSAVAREVDRSEAMLAELTQAQETAVEEILARQSAPLWGWAAGVRLWPAMYTRVSEDAAGRRADIDRYLQDPSEGMPLHLAVLALLVVGMAAARRYLGPHAGSAENATSASRVVFERPLAAAIVVALLFVAAPNSSIPSTVRTFAIVLGMGAVIRVARLTADPRLVPELYMLWALFTADSLREAVAGTPVIEQCVLALELLAGIGVLAYSLRAGALRPPPTETAETGRVSAYRMVARLIVLIFVVALLAGTLGYMRLARLLASGVLASGALALMLYASVHVLVGAAAFAFRVWPLCRLRMVQNKRDLLERRVRGLLRWLAIGAWGLRVLNYVGLLQLTWSLGEAVLGTKLGRGPIQISLGDILEFVLTVWVAYLVSAFIRFVLQEDVYPRTGMRRGISYAVSSLLNYVIIALGFVLALGAFGLDLSKVTVLAGAFGVGIGFGLQSVVNNFVSGLILLFERPVHVGDIVEVGDRLSGEVSRIGIRASTVRTWQGAEIIVPNAQLITERVTNWTLSDRTRRIDLRLGVGYGSPPDKVLPLLEEVGRAHPQVLATPAPQAYFIEFGDSAIVFELRAWTSHFERWGRIQTELATAAYAALHAAGISMPTPQYEVRMVHEGSAGVPSPAAAPVATAEAPSRRPPS